MSDLNNDFKLELDELDLGSIKPQTDLDEFTQSKQDISFIRNIPVSLTLEVASTDLMVGDLLNIGLGTIIELDKLSGEPMDVKVNGALLGHAEVVVINNKYGLRLIDVVDEKDMIKGLAQ